MIKSLKLYLLLVFGFIFESYKKSEAKQEKMDQYELIKKYLLNDSTLARTNKPILWIHITFETNARWWPHFSSRNTQCFNQPYQYLTIKSIVDHCGDSFNICLIDDDSFTKLIPGWTINLHSLASPIKQNIRQLAITKLLYNYGGMLVPASFTCFKNLHELYTNTLENSDAFVFQNVKVKYVVSHLSLRQVLRPKWFDLFDLLFYTHAE